MEASDRELDRLEDDRRPRRGPRPRSTATQPAIRSKRDGSWRTLSFADVWERVSALGRGLVDLGLEPGERVCILANTREEWTFADFAISAAGGVVVPIYPTNSPEECEWVAGNSGAVGVVCEDAAQVDEDLRGPRAACPSCAGSP